MKVIKFKGLTIGESRWVYGYYAKLGDSSCILNSDGSHAFVVNGGSVSQFTGYFDDKGEEIYDQDILAVVEKNEGDTVKDYKRYQVVSSNACWKLRDLETHIIAGFLYEWISDENMIVIGNIYDKRSRYEED